MKIFDQIKAIAKKRWVQGCFLALAGGDQFIHGLLSGTAEISTGHATVHMETAARATSPVWFWVIECLWLFAALGGVYLVTKDLIRISRGLPEKPPAPPPHASWPQHGPLPEALAELLRTGRIDKESVPRLLTEMRPRPRPADAAPVLHSRVLEWVGIILGLFPLAGIIAAWVESPDAAFRIVMTIIFGVFAAGFPVGFIALAASWRRRRRKQMEWILDREANYKATHEPIVAPPAGSISAAP
jgi:hypothetical protein